MPKLKSAVVNGRSGTGRSGNNHACSLPHNGPLFRLADGIIFNDVPNNLINIQQCQDYNISVSGVKKAVLLQGEALCRVGRPDGKGGLDIADEKATFDIYGQW